ncbi:MAG: adenylate kinase [Halobacteriota archaeon]
MSVHVVSGVPGAGVSSVASEATRRLDGVRLFNFGDVMLEQAVSRGIVESRDGLGDLPIYEQTYLQRASAEYLRDESSSDDLLVNARLVVGTKHGYVLGLPREVLWELNPESLVVVEASADVIAARRSESDYRSYGDSSEGEIEFHQSLNRSAALSYASTVSSTLHRVDNESSVDDSADRLVEVLA